MIVRATQSVKLSDSDSKYSEIRRYTVKESDRDQFRKGVIKGTKDNQ